MNSHPEHVATINHEDDGQSIITARDSASAAATPALKMRLGQKIVIGILLIILVVPPFLGYFSYFTGVPLHLLASTQKEEKEPSVSPAQDSVTLVSGRVHTLAVPDEVASRLGIRKGQSDSVAIAHAPTTMRPLVLPGTTRFDPARLDRIRA